MPRCSHPNGSSSQTCDERAYGDSINLTLSLSSMRSLSPTSLLEYRKELFLGALAGAIALWSAALLPSEEEADFAIAVTWFFGIVAVLVIAFGVILASEGDSPREAWRVCWPVIVPAGLVLLVLAALAIGAHTAPEFVP